ncbi:MAG: C40 family peptidase [Actinomycetia bacterium]|nr:C40 family peptidase [Actinomycetes bacterium]
MEDLKWYFEDPKKEAALKAELDSWLNTPYRHITGVKGRGCDCIHLVIKSFQAVGADHGRLIHIPKYPPDWHMHSGKSLLLEGLIEQYRSEQVKMDPANLMNGDVVLFQWGKHPAHSGIFFNGEVYQALTGLRVEKRTLKDLDFYNRMKHIIRIRN